MSNKTYNNIIALISFLTALAFVVCKLLEIISASWWLITVPWFLYAIFRNPDDDDNQNGNYSNLKMA